MFRLFIALMLAAPSVFAETHLTIIQTSDLHSHFTNRQSVHSLGGFARVKAKIDELRATKENTLLLDAGDWSEGSIFFTLDTGVSTQHFLDYMGYDAMVLGNHDWLVGPYELYDAFAKAEMKVPVLSANLEMGKLSPDKDLRKFIKPYIIKTIGGKRIGIFGLSTFELVFDHFFRPVHIRYPVNVAKEIVKTLRKDEKCDNVILLSHLGIGADKAIASLVGGIDIIVGGHTHLLLKTPKVVRGVPIFHVGKWGEYVGEYEFVLPDNGRAQLVTHKLHQIDSTVPEDPVAKTMVDGVVAGIENLLGGPVFSDSIVKSEVELPISTDISNESLGNWVVDGIRDAGKTDVALDLPFYYSDSLHKGDISTVDFFNMNPHIWSGRRQKAWTVFTYDVKGFALETLLQIMSKGGFAVKISNGNYQINKKQALTVSKVYIGGERLNLLKTYSVSSTHGVLDTFEQLKDRFGIDLGVKNIRDTGIEAWRAAAAKFTAMSPITRDKIKWEPRIRLYQGDLYLPGERVYFEEQDDQVKINFQIINQGLEPIAVPAVTVKVDMTPDNTLDDEWMTLPVSLDQKSSEFVRYSEVVNGQAIWPVPKAFRKGLYSVKIYAEPQKKEVNRKNNFYEAHFRGDL